MKPVVYHFNDAVLDERYTDGGESIRQLASAYGCSYGTIWRNLKRIGIPLRPNGGTPLDGRWSLNWEQCRGHGGTDIRYGGRGLCNMCYKRWRKAGRPRIWYGLTMIEGMDD